MTRLLICLVAPLVAPMMLFAQEDVQRPPGQRFNTREFLGLGAAPDKEAAARGEKLYQPNCAFCHGEKARGAEGPNLVRSTVVLHDEKGEAIAAVVSKGSVDRGMPAFPNLTKDQLYDLSQFLHLQVELVANRGLYRRLNIVTGDPKAGEAYFQQSCASCHSPAAEFAHIGSKYAPDQLQSRFVWPGYRAPRNVTVRLGNGETIAGRLKQIDDFEVSIYDATGAYHSWPANAVKVEIEDRLAAHRGLLEKYTDRDMHNITAYLVTLK